MPQFHPERLTFILDVGASASAARLRIAASSFKHRNDDVLIAISNSSRDSKEVMNVSAPAQISSISGYRCFRM